MWIRICTSQQHLIGGEFVHGFPRGYIVFILWLSLCHVDAVIWWLRCFEEDECEPRKLGPPNLIQKNEILEEVCIKGDN